MTDRQLKLSKTPFPCLTPKSYLNFLFILKLVLLSPLIILKVTILLAIFIYLFLHCCISVYVFPDNQNLYNYFFLPIFQIFTRTVLFIVGFYSISIKDERRNKRNKAIIITNHISTFDFMVVYNNFGGVPLTKAEMYRHPILSIFIRFLKMIPVERDTQTGRSLAFEMLKKTVDKIYESEDDVNNGQSSILINPEMSITNGESLIKFATGAFRFKKPVYPILVDYKGRNREVIMRFCETDPWSILEFLSCFYFKCEVRLLKEYEPNLEEQNNPRLYADNTCKYMAREYNCGVSSYTYADSLIYWEGFVYNKETGKYFNLFENGYYPFVQLKEKYKEIEHKTVIDLVKQYINDNMDSLSKGRGVSGDKYINDINEYLLEELSNRTE
eukprot:GAHX01000125.1.p1 GENE.GAHX01000125.1~~GAHX01000125.1.p1  ORF type:complete len:385 (+),score=57.11 GAHX01000125.1:59-1213(+)